MMSLFLFSCEKEVNSTTNQTPTNCGCIMVNQRTKVRMVGVITLTLMVIKHMSMRNTAHAKQV